MSVVTTARVNRQAALEALCAVIDRRRAKAVIMTVELASADANGADTYYLSDDGCAAVVYEPAAAVPFRVAYVLGDSAEDLAA